MTKERVCVFNIDSLAFSNTCRLNLKLIESTTADFLNAGDLSANVLCLLLPYLPLFPELQAVQERAGLETEIVTRIKSELLPHPDL